jgi:hypothetical protein
VAIPQKSNDNFALFLENEAEKKRLKERNFPSLKQGGKRKGRKGVPNDP